jgi:hypothetical protein
MAQKITAQLRVTHRYVDECSHLDKWGKTFTFKLLEGRMTREGKDYTDAGTMAYRAIGSKTADQKQQAQALRDTFNYHGCTHEHDCCGCISRTARVRKVKPGIFSIRVTGSRNY